MIRKFLRTLAAASIAAIGFSAPSYAGYPPTPYLPAMQDVGAPTSCPFIIINSGQSNAEGFDYSGGSYTHTLGTNILTTNANINSTPTSIITAAYGTYPWNQTTSANGGSTSTPNLVYVNQALSFATYLRNSGMIPASRPILVVPNWYGNQSISDWVDMTPIDMWTPLIASMTLVENTYPGCPINDVIWDQGEFDSTSSAGSNYNSFSLYQGAFTRLIAQYQALPGWSTQTRMQVVELAPFADNPEQARNDFLRTLQNGQGSSGVEGSAGAYPFITFVSGSGLVESTQNPQEHYDGYSQQTLGQRIFQAWAQGRVFGSYSGAVTRYGSTYAFPNFITLTSAGAALSPDQIRTGALVSVGGGTVTLPNPASMPLTFPPIILSAQSGTTTTISTGGTTQVDGLGIAASFNIYSGDTYEAVMQNGTTWLFKKLWGTGGGAGGPGFSAYVAGGLLSGTVNLPYAQTLGGTYTLNGATMTITTGKGSILTLADQIAASTVTTSTGSFEFPNGSTSSSLTLQPGQTASLASGFATASNALYTYVTSITPLTAVSASIGGSSLSAGACTSGAVTVNGASASSGLTVKATPNTDPGAGFTWGAFISSANTVTVRVCAIAAGTPTASTYDVSVSY